MDSMAVATFQRALRAEGLEGEPERVSEQILHKAIRIDQGNGLLVLRLKEILDDARPGEYKCDGLVFDMARAALLRAADRVAVQMIKERQVAK